MEKTELKSGEAPYKAVFLQYFCIYDISNFTNSAKKKLSYNQDMHNILSWQIYVFRVSNM